MNIPVDKQGFGDNDAENRWSARECLIETKVKPVKDLAKSPRKSDRSPRLALDDKSLQRALDDDIG